MTESKTWKNAYRPYEAPDCSEAIAVRIQKQNEELIQALAEDSSLSGKLPEIARRELGEECGR